MRLIDADDLIEKIKEKMIFIPTVDEQYETFYHNSGYNCGIAECLLLVENQSTAYSVEKVVAELEEASYEAKILEAKCKYLNYDDTIDIVRNGGRE